MFGPVDVELPALLGRIVMVAALLEAKVAALAGSVGWARYSAVYVRRFGFGAGSNIPNSEILDSSNIITSISPPSQGNPTTIRVSHTSLTERGFSGGVVGQVQAFYVDDLPPYFLGQQICTA